MKDKRGPLRPCHTERIPLGKPVCFRLQDAECRECPQRTTCKKATEERMSTQQDKDREVNVISVLEGLSQQVAHLTQMVHRSIATPPPRAGRIPGDQVPGQPVRKQTHQEFPPEPWEQELPPRRNLIQPRFEMGITCKLMGAEPTGDQRSFIWRRIDRVFLARHSKRLKVLRDNRNQAKTPKPSGKKGKWSRIDVAEELDMVNALYNVVCEVLPVPPDYFMPLHRRPAEDENLPTCHPNDQQQQEPQTESADAEPAGSGAGGGTISA